MYAEFLELYPGVLFIAVGLMGLLVGSFLNVVAYRLPIMMERAWRRQCAELAAEQLKEPPHAEEGQAFDLWRPRSGCPSCGASVAAYDNVPLVSYLSLRGRCRHCGATISARYPLVEAGAALLGLAVVSVFGPSWQTLILLPVTWTLLALSLIDIDRQYLPDSLTLPLLWAGLLVAALSGAGEPLFTDLNSAVIGAAAGYLSLWSVYQLFKLATGKEGMGYGDFKLLAALGAWLGWQLLPLVILLSAAVGALLGGALLALGGKSRQTPIPFGPYLAAAGWITLLWGGELTRWYVEAFF
ncbi:MAG TPA: A24 family peptidase [Gammaproteobacteria bacterium]|jgi:leader peptidase (prepilin peptidase)/N-methyltransferase